jgi:hypothetical protein
MLIILSPIKNVAVITLRRFHVFSDFPELAFAQLKDVPSYPIALRSRVAGKQFDNTIQVRLLKLLANTLEGALLHTFNEHHRSTAILAVGTTDILPVETPNIRIERASKIASPLPQKRDRARGLSAARIPFIRLVRSGPR